MKVFFYIKLMVKHRMEQYKNMQEYNYNQLKSLAFEDENQCGSSYKIW